MTAPIFTLESLSATGYTDMTVEGLPPFAVFLPGTSGAKEAHLAGPHGAVGQVSALQFTTGGFGYTDMPISESAFLLAGVVRVQDSATDDVIVVNAGQGFLLPLGFSGTVEAVEPVTKIFHVL